MTDIVILEKAVRLSNIEMKTLALQLRRFKTVEPEDAHFPSRPVTDLHFFILTLYRLRTAANISTKISDTNIRNSLYRAIDEYNKALPRLGDLRNIQEHQNECS